MNAGRLWLRAHQVAGAAAGRLGPAGPVAADVIGGLFHRLSADRRAVHARHLVRAFGRPLGRLELERRLRRSFRLYGRYWLEVLSVDHLEPEHVRNVLEIPQRPYLTQAADEGGCVLALAHLGNWDLAGAWGAAQGYAVSSVAEVLEPRELFEFFVDVRRRLGIKVYPLDGTSGAARGLLKDLSGGGVVCLLADRDIGLDGVAVTFFGEQTTLPGGPAALALRTGRPLIPTGLYSRPDRRYDAVLLDPVEPPARARGRGRGREAITRMTQALARSLEQLIRRSPEDWHLYQPNWPSDRRASLSTLDHA